MTEGPAAGFLAEQLADHLWVAESVNGDWPENLRGWLDDTGKWSDVPPGRTGFICGRIERGIPGGRVYLAWLGMNGVRLLNRTDSAVELDVQIGADEGWSPDKGPEPEGMALHAYRGSLFGLERLIVLTTAASALFNDLPDMGSSELEHAFADWAAESEQDLAVFDLRLHPVLNQPNSIVVDYRWVTPDQVELAWQPSPNATAYRIEESPTSDFGETTLLAELTDGRQSHYRLSPPTDAQRYYRLIPLNQGVAGPSSDPICPTPILLNAPIMEPVHWADDGGYILSWTPMLQATSYEVQTSFDPDFQGHDNQIIYRGDLPETFLSNTTTPGQYYRVRALNALYAPRMPSPWSDGERSPLRLPSPVFTRVSQKRIEWEPVRGAQQYVVRVTTVDETGAERSEEFPMRDTGCVVAEQHASYHVRAFRHPDDDRTASEWSEGITLSPKVAAASGFSAGRISGILWTVGLAAVLMGIALGWVGLEVYHDINATSTPTRFPQDVLDVTHAAGTQSAQNATAIRRTAEFVFGQTETATLFTATPTPTVTPNATLTVQAEFESRLTATASHFTTTPTPVDPADLTATFDAAYAAAFDSDMATLRAEYTATPTPIDPADLTATFDAAYQGAFEAGLTATAALFTATPTPDFAGTARAENQANLRATANAMAINITATAAAWTPTYSPTATPDYEQTLAVERTAIEQTVMANLTATATAWAATALVWTATPDIVATARAVAVSEAGLTPGCYVYNLTAQDLPVYAAMDEDSEQVLPAVPQFARVIARVPGPVDPNGSSPLWLEIVLPAPQTVETASQTVTPRALTSMPEQTGWLLVAPGVDENLVYGGDCQSIREE